MTFRTFILLICLLFTFLTSCAAADNANQPPDYESMKKMMVDMLKTDEGKQAIQELLADEEVRKELVLEDTFVRDTIQQTLTSEEGRTFWTEAVKDPEFAKTYSETMQTENEEMIKVLMKDPEYQSMLIDVLQDPEMEQALLELMKSKEYRQQVMTIISDAFESPYFVARINEILMGIAEEQLDKLVEKQDEQKQEEEGGQQEQSG
ncbi:spore germination lipoprotein GerD [Alkalihalobacillus hemicellulosilyticus]|uniref:Spore germination protein GerD n=1 Tax=Halalkalibacter hemicellulosilyticusJCM 9152 TaxID=1236971 RepID=W4QLX7_9BACI|nr:spore germination lipoprotein GerD [Halalkalibacter hemicellulosilyticus]GAE32897.1 spore germination protein GerD [Halalkalibacter hemicellulosilyticusJCM 9152]